MTPKFPTYKTISHKTELAQIVAISKGQDLGLLLYYPPTHTALFLFSHVCGFLSLSLSVYNGSTKNIQMEDLRNTSRVVNINIF